jgi:hypothetical protein
MDVISGKEIVAVAGAIPDEDVAKLLELCGKNLLDKVRRFSRRDFFYVRCFVCG